MSDLVVKSNTLNETVIYKKATELKIFSKIITLVRKDPTNNIFTFQIKDFIEEFNNWEKNYEYIKKVAKNMMIAEFWDWKKNIVLEVVFRRVDITEQGTISFKIDSEFKPYVLNLSKSYTGYYLENIASLKSGFSIRLYELLKQFEKSWWWLKTIEELRELFWIEKHKFKQYGDFKRFILKTAQKEIREKTDLKFTFDEIKTGRRVTKIKFWIMPNIKTKISSEEKKKAILTPLKKVLKSTKKETKEQLEIIKLWTKKLKLDNIFLNELLVTYQDQEKQVLDNIKFTIKKFTQGKIKESVGGFLRTAIKNNYASQLELLDPKKEQQKQVIQEEKNTLAANALYKKFSTLKAQEIEDYKNTNKKEMKNLVPIFIIKNIKILEFNKIDFENIETVETAIKNNKRIEIIFNSFIENNYIDEEKKDFKKWAEKQNIKVEKNHLWEWKKVC